jgi:hypothetical protein
MVKCCVCFEVWTEFLNVIMRSLHFVHEINVYQADNVYLSVRLSVPHDSTREPLNKNWIKFGVDIMSLGSTLKSHF